MRKPNRKRLKGLCTYCGREIAISRGLKELAPHNITPGVRCRASGTNAIAEVLSEDKHVEG